MKRAFADTRHGQVHYVTEGSGPTLLLLHQSTFDYFEYERVIPLLAERFRVIAPDTLGYGYSDPAPREWGFIDFTDSIIDFMNALGLDRPDIAGHHTGAIFAAEIAAGHPERVNRLVLSGCALYEPATQKDFYARQRALTPSGPLPPVADGSHVIRMWKMQQRENPDSPLESVHRAMIANFLHYEKEGGDAFTALLGYDLAPRLPLIQAPTLVINGSKDVIQPPLFKTPDTPAKLIPGAKYRVIEGGAILVAYDMPEEFARAILGFLD